jgi:DNA polymerase-3 subunit gamma/tau
MRDSWPEIVEVVQKARRTAWMVVVTATVVDFADDVLTLAFPSANDVESFKRPQGAAEGVSEYLRRAIVDVLGVKVKYIARVEGDGPAGPTPTGAPPVDASVPPATSSPQRDTGRSAAPATDAGRQASAPSPQGSTPAEPGRTTAATEPAARQDSAAKAASPSRTPAAATKPTSAERATAPASTERPGSPAPVTGWDVATIPQTPPPEPDEPEHITEEPPGGVPTVDAAPPPPEVDAAAAGRSGAGASPRAATTSTAASAAPAPDLSTGAGPSVAERRAATGDPRRGIPTGSRYGEAVVREILGAQFIEEETIAPRVTPQRSE